MLDRRSKIFNSNFYFDLINTPYSIYIQLQDKMFNTTKNKQTNEISINNK